MVLYLASDLLWATRIKSCAEDLAIPARPVRTVEMLSARLADIPPDQLKGLVLDLAAGEVGQEGVIAFSLLKLLRQSAPDTFRCMRVVAFGPHVLTEQFDAARAAASGAAACKVLSRGAFDSQLVETLKWVHGEA